MRQRANRQRVWRIRQFRDILKSTRRIWRTKFPSTKIKQRFGNSSQWYLEKQCAVSNMKRVDAGAFPPPVYFDSLMASLHWRFLLRFQRRFQGQCCGNFKIARVKLLAIQQRFESPVVHTGHLKSPLNRACNHRKNCWCKWAFRPWEPNACLVWTFMRFQNPWIVFKPRLIP